jgi:SAM-dependent methyltransferase
MKKNSNPLFEWLVGLRVYSSRIYLDQFVRQAAASLPKGALVLDAGAGNCLYKPHFSEMRYESADFCQLDKEYGEITYVCDLLQIPVEDCRYDLVLSTQTLEHVPEPWRVLDEYYRVLKPGGSIWLSAPFYFEEHELPYDFYRYTRYGMQHLVELAGFKVVRIEWLEGYFGTLSRQAAVAFRSLSLRPRDYGGGLFGLACAAMMLVLKPSFGFFSILFAQIDARYAYKHAGHCKNYTVVAIKEPPNG